MKPFRKHVAVAVDGGGIKGVMVAQALAVLEENLGAPVGEVFHLAAGTSTGAIISAGIGFGMTAVHIHDLYVRLACEVFPKTWRYYLWPFSGFKYPGDPLARVLREELGEITMNGLWEKTRRDVVITTRDLVENRTRFIKPWKGEYRDWPLWLAVQASCAVPAYFPVVEGRYVDGGVGVYANPCYLAAYEAVRCLGWDPAETTLLSFGTGRSPNAIQPYQASHFQIWDWLEPILDTFLSDASDQQVRVVRDFYPALDFRRFQIDTEPIAMDDVSKIDALTEYGKRLGDMVLKDEVDLKTIRTAEKLVE